jgi:hypothetical protein
MAHNAQNIELKWYQQLRIYCPLLPALGMIIIFIIFLPKTGSDLVVVTVIGTFLCLVGFLLTGIIASKELATLRTMEKMLNTHPGARIEDIEAYVVQGEGTVTANVAEEEDLSLPATLGTNGIYGIVIGLGISDALLKYVEKTSGPTGTIANYFANNTVINKTIGAFTNSTNYELITNNIIPIIQINLSESFRLSGFLFTIIPFIHGTILLFSKKWYLDTDGHPHYIVLLLFFIMVFITTIMYYFVGLNILDTAFFIFSLWILMAFNSAWLVVYSKIIKLILKKQYLVHREWVLLNLNTLAFLSLFLFASPNLLSINQIVGNNSLLNFLILIVLFSRILTDYIISWGEFYQGTIEIKKN